MYCPTCGNQNVADLNYCKRCGANLTLQTTTTPIVMAPPKLVVPSIVLGVTILGGLSIIVDSANSLALHGVASVAIVAMVLGAVATLFGCTALMIRFLTNLLTMSREAPTRQLPKPAAVDRTAMPPAFPHMGAVPSVTENTTRTFSPAYTQPPERERR